MYVAGLSLAAAQVTRAPPSKAPLARAVGADPARHSPDTACQTARVPIRRRLHPLGVERTHALEIAGLAALARFQFYWLEPKPHGPLASDAAGSARCCLHGLKRGIGDSRG